MVSLRPDHPPGQRRITRYSQTIAIAWQLARLDLIRRYTATGLGLGWVILAPLGMAAVIGTVFSQLFDQALAQFLPYLFVNLTLWAFFTACLDSGGISFLAAEGYIKQIPNVSLWAYPLRMTLAAFVALVLGLVAAAAVSLLLGREIALSWFSLIPALSVWLLFGYAVATLSAVLNTRIRDFSYLQTVIVQAFFYVTPVMYPPSMLTDHGLSWLLTFNPLYHLMMLVRVPIVYGGLPPAAHYLASGIVLALLIPLASFLLYRTRRSLVLWL